MSGWMQEKNVEAATAAPTRRAVIFPVSDVALLDLIRKEGVKLEADVEIRDVRFDGFRTNIEFCLEGAQFPETHPGEVLSIFLPVVKREAWTPERIAEELNRNRHRRHSDWYVDSDGDFLFPSEEEYWIPAEEGMMIADWYERHAR